MSSEERPLKSADGTDGSDATRRRRSPLAVVSVAAAVLIAGGGGAYLATTASEGGSTTPAADRNPPPLALDGHTETGPDAGIAPGEPDPHGVVYRAEGPLPEGPDEAAVYRAAGTVGEAEVAKLAAALGVPGTPRLAGTVWKIGTDKDGGGPLLHVNREAPGTWTFMRFGTSPKGDDCLKGKPCPSGGEPSTGQPGSGGAPVVSEETAKKAAAPVLAAVGQGDAALDATQTMGATRVVNADPVVGGLPTYGWSTGIQVGSDGKVTGGSGQLKEPAKGASYPVVSARETLEQLNAAGQRRGGIGGCATPVPVEGVDDPAQAPDAPTMGPDTPVTGPAAPGTDPGKPDTRPAKPIAPCEPNGRSGGPRPVVVSKAVFGLAVHSVDGRPALVPSWLFEAKPEGGAEPFTVTHPAIAPAYLKSAPAAPSTPSTRQPSPTGSQLPETTQRGVESYAVSKDGRTLTLRFWGGVCSGYSGEAEESATQVKVKIIESRPDPGRVCIMIAKELTEKVTLKEPLGDREVVDAQSGTRVPLK
ncbi:hypothetical protein [Streptomyces sp. NPDC059176]|uniref:hypothetical protein n=1 Tax=unclassified Streptomyces TaxID=2593676 RepID=UPI003678ABDB